MTCVLPSTGFDLMPLLLSVAALGATGAALLVFFRARAGGGHRGGIAAGLVLLLLAGGGLAVGGAAPAQAATDCPPTETVVLEAPQAPDLVLTDPDYQTSPGFYTFSMAMDSVGITTPNEGAVIDWASIDLQPDVPGIQHTAQAPLSDIPGEFASLVYDPATHVLTAQANWAATPGTWTGNYVVADSLGAWSNTATIVTDYPV